MSIRNERLQNNPLHGQYLKDNEGKINKETHIAVSVLGILKKKQKD